VLVVVAVVGFAAELAQLTHYSTRCHVDRLLIERENRMQRECEALEKANRQLRWSHTDLVEKSAQQSVIAGNELLNPQLAATSATLIEELTGSYKQNHAMIKELFEATQKTKEAEEKIAQQTEVYACNHPTMSASSNLEVLIVIDGVTFMAGSKHCDSSAIVW